MQVKAVKQGDEHILIVDAAPYGGPSDRDSDGEYFSPRTDFDLDEVLPIPYFYHGYTKRKTRAEKPVKIGRTLSYEKSGTGPKIKVSVDMRVEEGRDVWKAALNNNAVASSGSAVHLVRKSNDGEILYWPMIDISIWPYEPGMPQANKRAMAIPVIKAMGLDIPDKLVEYCESADHAIEKPAQASSAGGDSSSYISTTTKDSTKMDYEDKGEKIDVQSLVSDAVKSALEQADAKRKAEAEAEKAKQAAIEEAVKAEREKSEEALKAAKEEADAKLKAAEDKAAAEANRLPVYGQAPYQAKFGNLGQFDNASPDDLAFAWAVLNSIKGEKGHPGPSDDLATAIAVGWTESKDEDHTSVKSAMKMAGMPIKADELNRTTLAQYGQEWIGVGYSSNVWENVRLSTPIAANLPTRVIPQGKDSEVIPIETTAPTFYKVAQAQNQDANPGRITPTFRSSKMGTDNRTLNTQKLGAFVPWSEEMNEDSVVSWAAELRRVLMLEYAEVLEHMLIDGDVEAGNAANINNIAGTPLGYEASSLFDGFRKLALNNNANDALGFTVENYLDTMKLMGVAGLNGWRTNSTAFIVDLPTGWATLKLPELKNRDHFSNPTIESGMVSRVWDYPVYVSANMHRVSDNRRANAAGMIDLNTPANNTKGAILALRWDRWMMGIKRQVRIEVDRDIYSDANAIVLHTRVGLLNRDTDAAAISYNVTV